MCPPNQVLFVVDSSAVSRYRVVVQCAGSRSLAPCEDLQNLQRHPRHFVFPFPLLLPINCDSEISGRHQNMASNIPAALKSADIGRFAVRAAQLEKAKPIIAYWCESRKYPHGKPLD
jgi:hypothetical protein